MSRFDELEWNERQYDLTHERAAYNVICALAASVVDLFYGGNEGADVPTNTASKLKGAFLDLKRIASYYESPPEIPDWWTPAPQRGIPFTKVKQ